ncbi:MAG TPA: tetratricopeptide repeat protein [Vicinamibacterales bacterium]|nr:tetratricopeptide repeat protein [Vicinamibacterales bacterium]
MSGVWRIAAIVAVILAAYSNSFRGPFVIDDQASVVQNPDIRDLTRLDRVLAPRPDSPVAGRPLVNLTFAADYALHELEVSGYHVTNLAWHVACALLLFGVVRRTLTLPSMPPVLAADAAGVALAVALVWGVHPLTTEVVNYLSQRTESMMAFFLLLTLYAAIRSKGAPGRRWHALAIVACLAGTVCKETIAVAPLLVALYDRVYLYPSWREAARARGSLYLGLAASWLVLGGIVLSGPRAAVSGFSSGVSPWTYLLNQAVIVVDYLRLSIWPSGLVVLYGWPETLTLGDVLPYALGVVALLAITLVALVRAPRFGYLGAWFFIALAPASSVVPIATEVGAERRMYLPLMALVVLAVLGVAAVLRAVLGTTGETRRAARVASAVLLGLSVAGLAALTVRRTAEYASPVTLARTAVERRPTAVAHHLLGEHLALEGQNAEAEKELRAAIALGDSRARYQLGALLLNAQRFPEAASELEAFVATAGVPQRLRWLEPPLLEVLTSRLRLAQIYAVDRRWADTAAQARLVLEVAPRHPEALRLLGLALSGAQVFPEAVAVLREYLAVRPADATARSNLAIALIATGRLDDAVSELKRAVETEPGNANARRLLDMAVADQRALDAAR